MKLTTPEPQIDIGKVGFEGNCVLGRAEDGKKLSELIKNIEDPTVIAIDGPWGSGKSHFLKLWTGAHSLENGGTAEVVYFDAFKNDYLDDPLIALVGEIANRYDQDNNSESTISRLRRAGAKLAMPALRIGLSAATAGASELVGTFGDKVLEATRDEIDQNIDAFWRKEESRRSAVDTFTKTLQELTQPEGQGGQPKTLVIIMDELDRCRPDYALNLLEISKHFFAVPNVHFVLGANLRELENSVRARYGDAIDAPRYLQKFIHATLRLSENLPAKNTHVSRAYFDSLINSSDLTEQNYLSEFNVYFGRNHFNWNLTLRDIQRLIATARLTPPKGVYDNQNYQRLVVTGLMIIRVLRPAWVDLARIGSLKFADVAELFQIRVIPNDTQNAFSYRRDEQLNEAWKYCLEPDFVPTSEKDSLGITVYWQWDGERRDFLPELIRTHVYNFEVYAQE